MCLFISNEWFVRSFISSVFCKVVFSLCIVFVAVLVVSSVCFAWKFIEICALCGCLLCVQVDGGWFGRGALSRSHDGWPARACECRLIVFCVCLYQMSGL